MLPKPDAVSYVLGSIAISPYRYRCRVTVDAPAHEITEKIGVHAAEVTPLNDRQCELTAGAKTLDEAAFWLATLDADITIHEPGELRERIAALGRRFSNVR